MKIRRMVKIKSPRAPMPLDSHLQPIDPPPDPPTVFQSADKMLQLFVYIFAILMGLGQAWAGRIQLYSDGIIYIDLGGSGRAGECTCPRVVSQQNDRGHLVPPRFR